MEEKIYEVKTISGEYATLVDAAGDELFIAMALLPVGIDIGTKLRYNFPEFTLIE